MDAEFFATADEFEAWLEANGADADEVLVRMAKKHTGVASLDWAGAVEVALCFGWIDGRSKRIDDDWFVQRFTPRRPQSTWSKVNRQKVEALIAAARMRPTGLAEIERASRGLTRSARVRPRFAYPVCQFTRTRLLDRDPP
jgi:uncharacterized protein YdeI (YjbR/CyaY-like superfamily)